MPKNENTEIPTDPRSAPDKLRDVTDKMLMKADFLTRFDLLDPSREFSYDETLSLIRAAYWQGVEQYANNRDGEIGQELRDAAWASLDLPKKP